MKKIMLCITVFWATPGLLWATHANREPNSPAGKYQFSLRDIQSTVREAVARADQILGCLEKQGDLEAVAALYFDDYLSDIASYNYVRPHAADYIEAYKNELVNAVVLKTFKEQFPHLIYDRSKWMVNSVGGIYAYMIILYCSQKEYIVLWGTSGRADNKFSGYYPFMNEFDILTRGVMESSDVNARGHASVTYRPIVQDGLYSNTVDTSNLIPKNVRAYSLGTYTYMVSYAQGDIPKAFWPGAIMPGIFVNQDWGGLALHIKESIKSFRHLMRPKKEYEDDWKSNENYRALWLIERYQQAKS